MSGPSAEAFQQTNYEPTPEGTLTCPASGGGANWPGNSCNPVTRLFYVKASDWCAVYRKQQDPLVDNRWMGRSAPDQPGGLNFIRALDIVAGVFSFALAESRRGRPSPLPQF